MGVYKDSSVTHTLLKNALFVGRSPEVIHIVDIFYSLTVNN